jgi:hypothetical protein
MKKLIIIAAILIFGFSANADANASYSKRVGGYFYTALSPYGTWMEIDAGTVVWRPTMIRRNWSPYSRGQWLWTDYGWYWDSYEPFGHIAYHYGRWYYDDYYGWIWFPDDQWAPAWVDWRYDDDYIGWAPLSPYALFSISIGLYFTNDYYVPYSHWHYVRYSHFHSLAVYNYYIGSKYTSRIHSRTKYRRNYVYDGGRVRNYGVDYDRIRDRSGRSIEKRNILTVDDPREVSRDRDSKNRNGEIRTYIAKREDLSRDELRDVKISRSDRKTSLDLSKVELGKERTTDTRKYDNHDVKRKERDNSTIEKRTRTKDVKKEVQKDVTRDRIEKERKVQERNDVQKRNSEIEKRNNEQIKRNEEIKRREELKRNEQNKRNEQIEIQKRSNEEMKKRNAVINQKSAEIKNNTEILKQNNERKNEQVRQTQRSNQRDQNNTNINRNTEVKRDASTKNIEKRNNNNKTSEETNKTRSRR